MSDFNLRKFLAEQKAVKVETVKEEEAFQEEAVEETYHEGEDTMKEGDVTESVLAGIAALVGGTVGLGKLLDYLKSKGFELTDPSGKSVLDTTIRGLKKEEKTHEGEEMGEDSKALRVSMGSNAEEEQKVIDIARDAIALMDEQPGTSAEAALEAVMEDLEEEIKESTFKSSIKDILNS